MRPCPTAALAALLIATTLLPADSARAAGKATPAEIAAQRQESLDEMLSEDFQPALIANVRRSCVLGLEPTHVAQSRAGGAYFTPDAADSCVTALVRTARDGHLPDLYRDLLTKLGGDSEAYQRWPRVIGASVLGGTAKVPVGHDKATEITPAIAFDAGFTVAYQEGKAGKSGTIDTTQLKALAEACLSQHQDAGTCFSAGYMYGAHAFDGRVVLAN